MPFFQYGVFWKKRSLEFAAPAAEPPPAADADLGDRALDTLAALLRAYGNDAFDTDRTDAATTRDECEGWASRVLLGERGGSDEDAEGEDGETFRRDWGGVQRFFTNHRAHERQFVVRSTSNLKEALQIFARCLSVALTQDRAADQKLGSQLGRLVGAFQSNDSVAIRQEAMRMSDVLTATLEQRRRREAQQVELLSQTVQDLKEELRSAREQAAVDTLTRLYNRAALDEQLARVADLSFLLSSNPCVLMIDVDHFKAVNDKLGHPTGDQVLKAVADTLLRQFLRKEDFVARYGGEEFGVVIPDSTLENAEARAERLRQAIEAQRIEAGGYAIAATVSIGVAEMRPDDTGESWMARADAALYEAKGRGRNCVVVSPGTGPPGSLRSGSPSIQVVPISSRALPAKLGL